MGLTLVNGKEKLILTIQKEIRHRDYKRVCKIAKEYTAFVTGEDKESLIRQFKQRENDEQIKQRVELTDLVTGYIANRLMTPMFKVGRTPASVHYGWNDKDKTEEKKKELLQIMSEYYGNVSVDDYLATRLVELDCTDPNSFIVTDAEGSFNANLPISEENQKLKPYPFEVSAEEAIDYFYDNNKLQYLTVRNVFGDLETYTMYLDNEILIAQEISKDEYQSYQLKEGEEIVFKDPERKEAGKIFVLRITEHKLGKIPAVRIGCRADITTRNRTCVPLIHPAYAFFKKSIKTISEFDLTQTLHVFPQKITYKPACPGDIENQIICNNGKRPDGHVCSVCNGTGKLAHTSAQDVVEVKLPDDIKDIVSLENLIAYKHPPTELLEFMKTLGLDDYPDLAVRAVYCSELLTPDSTTTTATEKKLDLETVYDALKPFADAYSRVQKHIVTTIAAWRDLSTEKSPFVYEHKFPKDFKMKSLDQLLDDLKKAKDSGAPSYILNQIINDLEFKMFVDNPEGLRKIEVKRKYFPFNGKTEDQIERLLESDLISRYNKVLYANFDFIFEELELENSTENVNFFSLESSKIDALVKAKVEAYVKEINKDIQQSSAVSFGKANPEGGDGEISQDFYIDDEVMLLTGQVATVLSASPSVNGGTYEVRLTNGQELKVEGNQIKK